MNTDKGSKWLGLITLAVIAVAVYLRLSFVSVERMWPDEALYAWTSQRVFADPRLLVAREVMDFHPPLFTLLLAPAHALFPPLEACRATVFVLNLIGIVGIFLLGRQVRGAFLGCYAAGVLSLNLLYFNMSNLILSDGAVAVFIIFVFYALARIRTEKPGGWDLALGLSVIALILLKWSSVIVLPFLCLYYLTAFGEWSLRQRLLRLAVPSALIAAAIAVLIVHNHALLGSWVPQVFSATNESYREPFFYYVQNFHLLVFANFLTPFLLIGLGAAFLSRDRNQWAHALWVIVAFTALSAMASKDFRFLLPVVPSLVLVSGIGLEAVLRWMDRWPAAARGSRPFALATVFLLLVFVHYPLIRENVLRKAYMYTGYAEAGETVKNLAGGHPQAVVLASSPRMIRYFSGINFKEFGGQIEAFPKTREAFVRLASGASVDMILAIDRWEMAQPSWVYPPTDENNRTLKDLGFVLEKRVRRAMRTSPQKMEEGSVIWIFRRPAPGN